jgi:DUF1365 family protein
MRDLPTLLAEGSILHLPASVSHARRGALKNAFQYGADFVLTGPQSTRTLALLSRNRFNLFALYDRDNGGLRGQGAGAEWVWAQLARAGFQRTPDTIIGLMTQPRFLGYWFNPVSFWMIWKRGALCAVIAEVSNTFSQRHSYLCAHPDFRPIIATDTLRAEKIFHVSPFQDVSGPLSLQVRHHGPGGCDLHPASGWSGGPDSADDRPTAACHQPGGSRLQHCGGRAVRSASSP